MSNDGRSSPTDLSRLLFDSITRIKRNEYAHTWLIKGIARVSPRLKARIAGALYFVSLLMGLVAGYIFHDKAYTAGLLAISGMIVVTLLFYAIFRPVNKSLALLAATLNLVAMIFEAQLQCSASVWKLFALSAQISDPPDVFAGDRRHCIDWARKRTHWLESTRAVQTFLALSYPIPMTLLGFGLGRPASSRRVQKELT